MSGYYFSMNLKILSWNVSGLNNYRKRLHVHWIRKWKLDVICFQETKLKFVNYSIVNSLWNYPLMGWVDLVSDGVSGDILSMWNKIVVDLVKYELVILKI